MLSIALLAVILTAVGTSYALYRINITNSTTFKFVTGTLTLEISDSDPNGTITVNGLVPMSDATGMAQTGYSFTLTNSGTINAGYTMYLDDVIPSGETKTRVANNLIKINLTNTTTNTSNTYRLSDLTDRKLEEGILNATSSNSYILRIWLDESATNAEQNKYFAAKIRVDGVQANSIQNAGTTSAASVTTTQGVSLQQAIDNLSQLFD